MKKINEGQEGDIPISGWDVLTLPTQHVEISKTTRCLFKGKRKIAVT